MADEKWEMFMKTGKISDYLEYKTAVRSGEDGAVCGDSNS